MKITRRKLRQMITEAAGGMSHVQKIALGFKDAGADLSFIRQFFELAVALGHAQEGTLDTSGIDPTAWPQGIVDFVASPDLAMELHKTMGQIRIGRDNRFPGMYYVAYAV